MGISFLPISPVPPMITIFMTKLLVCCGTRKSFIEFLCRSPSGRIDLRFGRVVFGHPEMPAQSVQFVFQSFALIGVVGSTEDVAKFVRIGLPIEEFPIVHV